MSMSYEDIKDMIDDIGLDYAYYQWDVGNAPALPYILFYYPERNDFIADETNYVKITRLNIELYTDNKDFTTESTVEAQLEEYGLVYTKEEQYIPEERMYEVLYTMEVSIDE